MKAKHLRFLLVIAVLAGGFAVMKTLIATGPVAKKRTPPPMKALVETVAIEPAAGSITIEGMGSVIAAREVHIHSQVSGRIVEVAPELLEGKFVEKDKILARIEPDDYALAVSQAESNVDTRTAELEIEMGNQKVAQHEWELLSAGGNRTRDSSLALRAPQLAQAKAAKATAEALLERARLDLSRTELRVPFDALVIAKDVELGSMAAANGSVASLVSTDAFHVQVSIPESQLGYLDIPGAEAKVWVSSSKVPLPGRVISLLADLDPEGRMARVLVEVSDPFGLSPDNAGRPKLLLGAYVTVELAGRPLSDVCTIPRDALHDNDTVWLAREDGTLEIRKVEVLWKNRGAAMISEGLHPGEKLITTSLSFASEGMPVVEVNDASSENSPRGKPGPGKDRGDRPIPAKGTAKEPQAEAPAD